MAKFQIQCISEKVPRCKKCKILDVMLTSTLIQLNNMPQKRSYNNTNADQDPVHFLC